jgi:hypothetical protein
MDHGGREIAAVTRNHFTVVCLIAAAAVLLFEGFVWIRFGRWPGCSVMDLVTLLGLRGWIPWRHVPWLSKALAATPLPALLVGVALLLSWRPSRNA